MLKVQLATCASGLNTTVVKALIARQHMKIIMGMIQS